MEIKKYHSLVTASKANRKIAVRGKLDKSNTHIYIYNR